jgi:putative SOS response-associated peptidase YedK
MCGRAAQTQQAAATAAKTFGASFTTDETSYRGESVAHGNADGHHGFDHHDSQDGGAVPHHRDNFNMSPGMDVMVIYRNAEQQQHGELQMDHKKWGLISKSGTAHKPLYQNDKDILQLCFSNLCYNARSDTLYAKPTFSRLALQGKTCIVALDGYFEWKATPLVKGKQPYFVYRKDDASHKDGPRQPLFMAGLWTRVSTGHADRPTIDSFSILTTEACPQISWLHHRMPLCIWDMELARQWLYHPSEKLKNQLDEAAQKEAEGFAWHKVTTEMSKLQFRGQQAILPVKETTQSVKNFFTSASSSKATPSSPSKTKTIDKEVNTEEVPSNSSARGKDHKTFKPKEPEESKKRSLDATTKSVVVKQESSTTKPTASKATMSTTPSKKIKTKATTALASPGDGKQKSITSFFQQKK